MDLSFSELLCYTNDERDKWRTWMTAHPEAVESILQPGGQLATVGKTIDHIFLAERRFLQRLTGDALAESTGLSGTNAIPLFDYGASVRRELEQFVGTLDDGAADLPRQFVLRDRAYAMSARKILFHLLLHETRHWAQIALALRQAGLEPPGQHDLFYSRALR